MPATPCCLHMIPSPSHQPVPAEHMLRPLLHTAVRISDLSRSMFAALEAMYPAPQVAPPPLAPNLIQAVVAPVATTAGPH
ncbi:hypothetical protein PAPYR_10892 [Paratrimastix pyriformis]|uniref:Uncharacterized protein n=1 Tax=Paratrimastix pyriformis TaxID=342808 RepID=A0ABQ8U974_9EUKA|nr:hypothetical protein PAPYR_10892 [Paratrimastix pyriformis]